MKRVFFSIRYPGMTIQNCFVMCLLFFMPAANAQYFETAVSPQKNEQYKKAAYRIWLPPGVKTIRGIIFRQHGCGTGASAKALDYANDLQWQALAAKHNMALMGSQLEHGELCAQWFDLDGGSERAFFTALSRFAGLSKHPELKNVPWALYGHSGGAYWCTNLLFKYPERILCVVNRSGGLASSKWNARLKEVPVLWVAGEYDITDSLDYVKALTIKSFSVYRKYGAPWAMAIDPKADHGNRYGRSLYIPYMDMTIQFRLPAIGINPRPLDLTSGWLGNWKMKTIFPSDAENNPEKYCWFPTRELAEKWKEFITTGWVTDSSPPAPPTNLRILKEGTTAYLTWEAVSDLESGLKEFVIYKDGIVVGRLKGQQPNHGDVAQPCCILYRFPIEDRGKYAVSVLNHQGLESKKLSSD